VPPVISIHGDADPLVPYQHSVRLNDALQKAGVAHELVTIPGGGHGNFAPDQWQRAYDAIAKFLATHVTRSSAPSSAGKPQ
jgi:dipeptidyl aminopeptidase/acylaminoacyl peptidase